MWDSGSDQLTLENQPIKIPWRFMPCRRLPHFPAGWLSRVAFNVGLRAFESQS
jgi:hypothetical protein